MSQTFVHMIESSLQKSHTVVTVMEHVLKKRRMNTPGYQELYTAKKRQGATTVQPPYKSVQITMRKDQVGSLRDRYLQPTGR